MKIIGIDLAGKEENKTGFCVLIEEKGNVKTKARTMLSDHEIFSAVKDEKPDLVAIDAPFNFPAEGYFRDSETELKRLGFKPLSPKFPGMRPLVERAMRLVDVLRQEFRVIEVFSNASEKILGLEKERLANEHEYDALVCALTGLYYLRGKFMEVGKEKIVIPEL